MEKDKIRVVVADDSALMRKKISEILSSDPLIDVVATARNGKEAFDLVLIHKPNVVTLDVEMPILNGLETLGYIMSECPTPCVVISAFTAEGAEERVKALEFGAVDVIAKPGEKTIAPNIQTIGSEIIEKVKAAADIEKHKLKLIWAQKPVSQKPILKKPEQLKRVFAIASSTGGTQALATILPKLAGDLEAAILVAQHMPAGFTKSLAERLNWQSHMQVVEAENNMRIKPGRVIIAQGGAHLHVMGSSDDAYVIIKNDEKEKGIKPSADVLLSSVARVYKNKTVGIVLTGMGRDGTQGSKAIKDVGGMVLAEHEASCVVYGMPRAVVEAGFVDNVVALGNMAYEIQRIIAL
jgi:two-component system, chemotaxis family, protein-glutamate methylesterase/glutaminase